VAASPSLPETGAGREAEKTLITPPEKCAADIINGLRRGNNRIITGNKSTSMWWMARLFPNSYPALLKRLI
jgi:short-subunit dehydrogenase